jgi:protein-disulfide isomerase/uncharacterized membrane protein
MMRNRLLLVVMLAVVGSALAGLLLLDHHGIGPAKDAVQKLCGAGEESGCDRVAQSRFSSVGGFSVAGLGLLFYASVLLLLALALVSPAATEENLATLGLVLFGVALFLDVVLFGVQAFAIGAYCKLCIGTYVVNLLALVALAPLASRVASLAKSLASGEARSAASVWAMGSLLLLFGLGSLDQALASVAQQQHANLLGSAQEAPPRPPESTTTTTEPELEPVPVPVPVPVAVPSAVPTAGGDPPPASAASRDEKAEQLEADLKRAQSRIQELQTIVDDPQKYNDYQAEKAARQFEGEAAEKVVLDAVPFKGPADAPIKVAEFSDFLCPFCRNLAGAFNGFMHEGQGKNRVAIYFKNYPLDQTCNTALPRTVHVGACEVALGGICANEQGKFWEYHDRIFSQPPDGPTRDVVVSIGAAIGLNGDALRQCMGSSAARDKLDRDILEGQRLEVKATPTVFVNGKRLEQLNAFLKAIESEAKRLGLPD